MKRLLFTTLSLALACVISCKPSGKNEPEQLSPDIITNPATAESGQPAPEALPEFTFETDQHHFGVIQQGEVVSYSFKFTNTGKGPLIISSAQASCGCTVPEYTKDPVAPGATGYINVTFNSEGKAGMVSKTVTLISNTIPNSKVLTISAEIQVPKK